MLHPSRFALLLPLALLAAAPAVAEVSAGEGGFRAYDILDLDDQVIGELLVTSGGFDTQGTNLSAGSEHWHWEGSPFPDHFRIEASGAGAHSVATPFQRYAHVAFPTDDDDMVTVGTSPKAWRATLRPSGGSPVALDLVLTRDGSTGSASWYADADELDGNRLVDLLTTEQLQFDRISSNPGSMPASPPAQVRVIVAQQL